MKRNRTKDARPQAARSLWWLPLLTLNILCECVLLAMQWRTCCIRPKGPLASWSSHWYNFASVSGIFNAFPLASTEGDHIKGQKIGHVFAMELKQIVVVVVIVFAVETPERNARSRSFGSSCNQFSLAFSNCMAFPLLADFSTHLCRHRRFANWKWANNRTKALEELRLQCASGGK